MASALRCSCEPHVRSGLDVLVVGGSVGALHAFVDWILVESSVHASAWVGKSIAGMVVLIETAFHTRAQDHCVHPILFSSILFRRSYQSSLHFPIDKDYKNSIPIISLNQSHRCRVSTAHTRVPVQPTSQPPPPEAVDVKQRRK